MLYGFTKWGGALMKKHSNLRKYYKKVWRALNCSSKAKKQIMDNMKSDIEDYIEANPNVSDEQIIEKFGEPKKYAKAYLATLDEDELCERIKINRFGKKFWVVSAIIIILILIITIVGIISHNNKKTTRYYSEDVVSTTFIG